MEQEHRQNALKRTHAVTLLGDRATHAVVTTVIHRAREAMRPDRRTGQRSKEAIVTEMKRRIRVELDRQGS